MVALLCTSKTIAIFLKLFKWEWTEKKKEKVSLIYVNSDEQ